jgi:uncharacterized protein (TIGR00255 family)
MRSMTGYGEARGANNRYEVAVSIRSVNHRFLDLQLRIDEGQRSAESALRALVGGEVSRGRVEARIDTRSIEERPVRIEVKKAVVEAAHDMIQRLAGEGLVEGRLLPGDLLRLPEAFRVIVDPITWTESDDQLLLELGKAALTQLVQSRAREGKDLQQILGDRITSLEEIVTRLAALREPVVQELHAALTRRVSELLGAAALDPSRVAQEVALQVDRGDVSEEVDRLGAHLEHIRVLTEEKGPTGKRLDFLTQEILRELNTLGAKCRNAEMTRLVVDAKVQCEQLREQVQNVE